MVRKEWEGEAWPRVIVWHLYGFIVAAFLYLRVPGDSLLSKHAVQEVPCQDRKGGGLQSDMQSVLRQHREVFPWTRK